MANQVVRVTSMFTGAEAGSSFLKKLTTDQLEALINHDWPEAKNSSTMENPILTTIKSMKKIESNNHNAKPTNPVDHLDSKKEEKKFDFHGVASSRAARLKSVIEIGRKLRSDGKSRHISFL